MLVAEPRDVGGGQHEVPGSHGRQPQVDGCEDSQDMPVRDQADVTFGGRGPSEHAGAASGHLRQRLAERDVVPDAPELPPSRQLLRRQPLCRAVVPLAQVAVGLGLQTGEPGGAGRAESIAATSGFTTA